MKFNDITTFLSANNITYGCFINTDKYVKIYFDKKVNILRSKNFLSKLFKEYKIIDFEENINKKDSPLYDKRFPDIIRYVLIIFKERTTDDERRNNA